MTDIDKIIKTCTKPTPEDCLSSVKQLSNTERDVLMRVFEFNPNRFDESLAAVLNYLIK